ncbi:hypothetical protein ACFRCX_30490 [Streptomyces sp. NPDC056652]|uniref:hypothetical protein n=1 Tax=Streptomyces sp. NPDC056652 TaxID=3345893 RepID=UPI003692F28A
MNIERGPRKARGFVIIDNALAQNNALSFGARGLAEYLLSLPPGSRVDIRSLAADNPEGRNAIAGFMNELEAAFYLIRTRAQGERGRFVTTCTMHEEPQDPSSIPESLPKPWSKAKVRKGQYLQSVPSEPAEEFSQVGPNPASPAFGQPAPGRPGAGETGVNPYGVKEPGKEPPPPTPVVEPEADGGCASGGGGGNAPQQQDEDLILRAAGFVDLLPYRGRIPGPKQRAALIQGVAAAFTEGWTDGRLLKQLTEETSSAKSLAAVYRHRLGPENLPAAPLLPEPRTGDEGSLRAQRAKCPECHRPLRNSTEDALCVDCREDATA